MAGESGAEGSDSPLPGFQFCLRYGHRDVLLGPGKYLIGRSSSCNVVLDAPLVSRRHAVVDVDANRAAIADLGSRNGVFVNGVRVRGTRVLRDGDTISLGAETLDVTIGRVALSGRPTRADRREDTPTGMKAVVVEEVEEHEDQGRTTLVSDDLELIGAVAERALQAGHVADAENMLRAHLDGLLLDAGRERRSSPAARARAFGFGLRLAEATGKGSWFDYAVDLLRAERVICSERQVDQLRVTMHRVKGVDPRRLVQYAAALRSTSPTMESLRAAQQIDELAAAAARLQR
jgi:pSer/pThr/pTyr-binding forkhead associated (FHA) protein